IADNSGDVLYVVVVVRRVQHTQAGAVVCELGRPTPDAENDSDTGAIESLKESPAIDVGRRRQHRFIHGRIEVLRRKLGRSSGQQAGIQTRDGWFEWVQDLGAEDRTELWATPQGVLEVEATAEDRVRRGW